MLFCLHQSIRSHLISLKIHASHKYGFKNFWNFFVFDSRINKDYSRPDALRQLSLLGVVDKDVLAKIESLSDCHGKNLTLQESTKDYFFKESIPPWASMNVADHIKPTILLSELSTYISSRKTIFIAPGSVWATKKWSKEGYREVIEEWVDEANIVLVGSKGEIELCQELAKGIDSIIDLSGQTSLYELAGVFKQGDVLVTNDSGAMHVAASAGLPILSIFGPTTLKIGYRPWSSQATVIQRPLKCRPCGKHGHDKCPIGTHECMKSISAKVVSRQIKKYFLT